MENKSLLGETFNMYYNKAKSDHAAGNLAHAKRNYLLAAEALMKLAQTSPAALQKAQVERAKKLVDISENLDAPQKKVKSRSAESGNEESGKQFIAAEIPNISFNDIVGLDEVKRAITIRMINPIKFPEQYALYGKKTGGGVLLYGPPGTGKTMIAKAIAHEVGAKFYVIKGSDIVSKWVGDSEQNINSLFEQARKDDKAIIFIDEMDSLFGQRGNDVHNDRRVNEFLQQIDGFASKSTNILLLGATNRPWDVDGAAMRSGRFSQKIYIPLPDNESRKFLFQKYTNRNMLSEDVNFDELVRVTNLFSGADIAEVCDRAIEDPLNIHIATGRVVKIRQLDFLKAIKAISVNIDKAEIAKFEKYAGVTTSDVLAEVTASVTNIEEIPLSKSSKHEPIKKAKVQVVLEDSVISLIPNVKPHIEFALEGGNFDKVYLLIDTKHYSCTRKLNNYISDKIDIDVAGDYSVAVLHSGQKITEFVITFVKGMKENNFEL